MPAATAEVVAIESVVPLAELVGEKLPLAPDGNPDAEKLTALAKPLVGATLIASVVLAPGASVTVLDAGVSVKFAPAVMTSDSGAVTVVEPHVPVSVSGYVPVGVASGGYTISVLPENAVPTPDGAPETDNATELPQLKPLTGVTVMFWVAPEFCCSVQGLLAGVRVNVGCGAALTTGVRLAASTTTLRLFGVVTLLTCFALLSGMM